MRRFIVPVLALAAAAAGAQSAAPAPGSPGRLSGAQLYGSFMPAAGGPSLGYATREQFTPHGAIAVQVGDGRGSWITAGGVVEDQFLRTRTIDLSPWNVPGKPLTVRLGLEAAGNAHVDAVLVDGRPPRGLDARLARKLSAVDNDVIAFSEVAGTQLTFEPADRPVLTLVARVEPAVLGTEPLAFPPANVYADIGTGSSFYAYRAGARPWAPVVDGSLAGERLGAPLFEEALPAGSGHPETATWGWVGDDGTYLYAAIDLTGDNTMDGGVDYAALHVKTPRGVRVFTVTSSQDLWGRTGFEYTPRVGWEHTVYEMKVPLAALGAARGDDLQLAFTVYGTMGAQIDYYNSDLNGVDPDAGPTGTSFTFTVKYWDSVTPSAPQRADVWIDLNGNGVQDAAGIVVPFTRLPPTWLLVGAGVAAAALLLRARRAAPRLVPVVVAALVLGSCAPPQTTQEIWNMAHTGTAWTTGVIFTADVVIDKVPGTYTYKFLFEDSAGAPVGSLAGPAGTHSLTIDP